MGAFMNFATSIIVHKTAEMRYFTKQIINLKPPNYLLQNDI